MPSPELARLLSQLRSQPVPDSVTIEQLRAGLELLAGMYPLPDDVQWQGSTASKFRGEWVSTATSVGDRTILYFHGGGYVMGSPHGYRDLVARIARASRARVLSVDYRLAPEAPFPAATQDAFAAYRWLLESGRSPDQIVVGGDSAGGGLALATLVALRDARLPLPAGVFCLSPWIDLECSGRSICERADLDPLLRPALLRRFAEAYLGDMDPRIPIASPLHADFSGLPPILVQVGTAEILYDDSARLAEKAAAAGVEVTFEPWPEMIHVWHVFAAELPEGRDAIRRVGEFVQARTP